MRRHVRALFAIAALGSLFAVTGSAQAAECPNEAIRIAQGATRLPDCRAYERVSPTDGAGGVVGVGTLNEPRFGAMRGDGNAAAFGSSSAVGDAERSPALGTSSLARRTDSGWKSFSVVTTSDPSVAMDPTMSPTYPTPSPDMTRMMFVAGRTLGPPNPVSSGGSIYLSAPEGKGAPTWLSHWSFPGTQPNPSSFMAVPLGGSPDFSSGYFRYATPLTSLAGDDLRTSQQGLYYFEGSTIYPAGVLPSGTVSPLGAAPAGTLSVPFTSGAQNLADMARNQVSADGSKLFFVSPAEGAGTKQLYVQEGRGPGRLVSRDSDGDAAATGVQMLNARGTYGYGGYAYATADGSRVLFDSADALTDDAPAEGIKTYRAEITPGAITLTYLPAVDGTPLAVDEDASTILFATKGSTASLGSFYLWDEDRPGSPFTVAADISTQSETAFVEPQLSADGSVVVFASGSEVEAGVTPLPEPYYVQIYRWTKQSETATCISCRRDGGTPGRFGGRFNNMAGLPTDNPAVSFGATIEIFGQSTVVNNRKISSDGSRVFFDTNDPLDPARDVNNARDVYMWENGRNYLLTSGRNPVPSLVLDNSKQGDSVMLVTKDGLVPSDTNGTYDVYSVRVDGGFAEPVKESCEGDACQGPGSGSRQAAVPGSAILTWGGSDHESRKGKARSRKALPTTQLGRPGPGKARVRIQVPSAGKVSIAGADIKNASRQVKPGAVVIAVGLSPHGKSKLARKGQLKATVKVTFRPESGATTRKTMKLSFAGPKEGRR